jgi:hypothetical protein
MLIALVLAVTATASPAPPSLASLRVIANVHSTPLCSVLRTRVGPAIGALLENDATIDLAPPAFDRMYRSALLGSGSRWGGSLESLIGPVANKLKQIDDLLADKAFDEPRLAQVKARLGAAEAQQKSALNVISGYDATSQLSDILNAGDTSLVSQVHRAGFFGAARSIGFQGPRTTPGRMDISLAYNPYRPFAQAIIDMRTQAMDAESVAASSIAPIVTACQAP